jgi:lipopolysaccharide transport system permease protein
MNTVQSISIPVPRWRRVVYLRDLLRELVLRDLKAQYKSSLLGVAWSLLNPLMQLLVFTFLFRVVVPLNIEKYPAFAFCGLLAWTWFQLSLMQATSAITSHRELIRRPGFPAAILPVITVTTHLINLLIALPLLIGVVLLNGGSISTAIVTLPFVMAVQFILVLSLAYLLATANVLFRDTQHLIGVCLQLLFFLTPVFYSVQDRVPERYRTIYELNPMVHLVGAYRDVLIHNRLPDPMTFLVLGVGACALLGVGYFIFTRMRDRFVEEL